MAKELSEAAGEAVAAVDWDRVDAMTDEDLARHLGAHPDRVPVVDVRAIRSAAGMTQAEFASVYEFSLRTVQAWERGTKNPSGPARTLLRAIRADPEGIRRAIAAG